MSSSVLLLWLCVYFFSTCCRGLKRTTVSSSAGFLGAYFFHEIHGSSHPSFIPFACIFLLYIYRYKCTYTIHFLLCFALFIFPLHRFAGRDKASPWLSSCCFFPLYTFSYSYYIFFLYPFFSSSKTLLNKSCGRFWKIFLFFFLKTYLPASNESQSLPPAAVLPMT